MGMIYLAQPRGNRIRSIDKLKPKDRKKPANCNDSNVKFGKHLSNFSDLKDRYERLVGDVDFNAVSKNAAAITPVPGGVGPMTITMLLWNTVLSLEKSIG